MTESPLATTTLFMVGPIPITSPVVVTWGIMAALTLAAGLVTRALLIVPSRRQSALELVVGAIEQQIRETMRVAPRPYLSLVGTIFVFILTANWSSIIPGVEPPTANLETDAALALIVFIAAVFYGIRARGLAGYLKTFAEPTLLMVPLNLVETVTRTFSLIVRLFGNVMSGVFLICILLSLVGLIVPVPLMALDLLTGAVQAYIFAVLTMVFIGAVVNAEQADKQRSEP